MHSSQMTGTRRQDVREQEFLKRLDECEGAIRQLLSPPFAIEEVADVLHKLAQVIDGFAPEAGPGERRELFALAWDWLKHRYDVLSVLDRMIDLPQPWEALDRMAIDMIVRKLVIPLLAGGAGKKT